MGNLYRLNICSVKIVAVWVPHVVQPVQWGLIVLMLETLINHHSMYC